LDFFLELRTSAATSFVLQSASTRTGIVAADPGRMAAVTVLSLECFIERLSLLPGRCQVPKPTVCVLEEHFIGTAEMVERFI
jgi:hypothetical protein